MNTTKITHDSALEGKLTRDSVDLFENTTRLPILGLQFQEDLLERDAYHRKLWQQQAQMREQAMQHKVFRFAPVGYKKSVYASYDTYCSVPINLSLNTHIAKSLVQAWNAMGKRKTREELKDIGHVRRVMFDSLIQMIEHGWFKTNVTPRSFQYCVQKFKNTGIISYPSNHTPPITKRKNFAGKYFLRILQCCISPECFTNKAITCLQESLSTNVQFISAHGKTSAKDLPKILKIANLDRKFPLNTEDILLLSEAFDGIKQLFNSSGIYKQARYLNKAHADIESRQYVTAYCEKIAVKGRSIGESVMSSVINSLGKQASASLSDSIREALRNEETKTELNDLLTSCGKRVLSELVSEKMDSMMTSVKDTFSAPFRVFAAAWESIKLWLQGLISPGWIEFWEGTKESISELLSSFVAIFSSVQASTSGIINKTFGAVKIWLFGQEESEIDLEMMEAEGIKMTETVLDGDGNPIIPANAGDGLFSSVAFRRCAAEVSCLIFGVNAWAKSAFSAFIGWVPDLFAGLIKFGRWCLYKMSGDPKYLTGKTKAQICSVLGRAYDLLNRQDKYNLVKNNRDFATELLAVREEMQRIEMRFLVNTEVEISVSRVYFAVKARIEKLAEALVDKSNFLHQRIQPSWTYMQGPSRMGKSTLTTLIGRNVHEAAIRIGLRPKGDVFNSMSMYEWPDGGADVFHPAYGSEDCVFFKEHFAARDEQMRVENALTMLSINSTEPYMMNMADVERKGTIYFNSSVLISASNVDIWTSGGTKLGIENGDALVNRVDFPVTVYRRSNIAFDPDTETAETLKEKFEKGWYLLVPKRAPVASAWAGHLDKYDVANNCIKDEGPDLPAMVSCALQDSYIISVDFFLRMLLTEYYESHSHFSFNDKVFELPSEAFQGYLANMFADKDPYKKPEGIVPVRGIEARYNAWIDTLTKEAPKGTLSLDDRVTQTSLEAKVEAFYSEETSETEREPGMFTNIMDYARSYMPYSFSSKVVEEEDVTVEDLAGKFPDKQDSQELEAWPELDVEDIGAHCRICENTSPKWLDKNTALYGETLLEGQLFRGDMVAKALKAHMEEFTFHQYLAVVCEHYPNNKMIQRESYITPGIVRAIAKHLHLEEDPDKIAVLLDEMPLAVKNFIFAIYCSYRGLEEGDSSKNISGEFLAALTKKASDSSVLGLYEETGIDLVDEKLLSLITLERMHFFMGDDPVAEQKFAQAVRYRLSGSESFEARLSLRQRASRFWENLSTSIETAWYSSFVFKIWVVFLITFVIMAIVLAIVSRIFAYNRMSLPEMFNQKVRSFFGHEVQAHSPVSYAGNRPNAKHRRAKKNSNAKNHLAKTIKMMSRVSSGPAAASAAGVIGAQMLNAYIDGSSSESSEEEITIEAQAVQIGMEQTDLHTIYKIARNMRWIYFINSKTGEYAHVRCLKNGTDFCVNQHIFDLVPTWDVMFESQIEIQNPTEANGSIGKYVARANIEERKSQLHSEGILITVPIWTGVMPARKITQFLTPMDQFQDGHLFDDLVRLEIAQDKDKIIPVIHSCGRGRYSKKKVSVALEGSDVVTSSEEHIIVKGIASSPGDCGKVYLGRNKDGCVIVRAMHFGGYHETGYALPLCKEDFTSLVAAHGVPYQKDWLDPAGWNGTIIPGTFTGPTVKKEYYAASSSGQDYQKSMFLEAYSGREWDYPLPIPKVPVERNDVVEEHDDGSTTYYSVWDKTHRGYVATTTPPLHPEFARMLREEDPKIYHGLTDHCDKPQCTMQHIIVAVFGDANHKAIDFTATMGMDAKRYGTRDRRDLFDVANRVIKSKLLINDVYTTIAKLRKGKLLNWLCKQSLKGELLPVADVVEEHKVRGFTHCGLVMQIVMRMVLMDALQYLEGDINSPLMSEFSPHNYTVLDLYNIMHSHPGKYNWIGIDKSKNDTTLPNFAGYILFFMLNNEWFHYARNSPDYLLLRGCCMMVHMCWLVRGFNVVIRLTGLDSGVLVTCTVNGVGGYSIDLFSFFLIYPEKDYTEFVRTKHGGDDCMKTVSHQCPLYNNLSLQFCARQFFGMIYTAPDKGELKEYDNEEDIVFLQRKFNRVEGVLAFALNKDSIVGCLNYVHKNEPQEILASNCRTALHEAVYHGEEYFEELRNALIKCRGEAHFTGLELGTWRYYHRRWLSQYLHSTRAINDEVHIGGDEL